MLVRFILSGPVKFGPATIHGLPGQIADMDGEDLKAAIAAGMVELIEPEPTPARAAKRGGWAGVIGRWLGVMTQL